MTGMYSTSPTFASLLHCQANSGTPPADFKKFATSCLPTELTARRQVAQLAVSERTVSSSRSLNNARSRSREYIRITVFLYRSRPNSS